MPHFKTDVLFESPNHMWVWWNVLNNLAWCSCKQKNNRMNGCFNTISNTIIIPSKHQEKSQNKILLSRNVYFKQIHILWSFYLYILNCKISLILFSYLITWHPWNMICIYLITLLISGGETHLLELSKNIYSAKMDALLEESIITKRMVICSWLISIIIKTVHHELLPFLDICSDIEVVLIFSEFPLL